MVSVEYGIVRPALDEARLKIATLMLDADGAARAGRPPPPPLAPALEETSRDRTAPRYKSQAGLVANQLNPTCACPDPTPPGSDKTLRLGLIARRFTGREMGSELPVGTP